MKWNKHTNILAALQTAGKFCSLLHWAALLTYNFTSYDDLVTRFHTTKQKPEPVCVLGIQIAVEKIAVARSRPSRVRPSNSSKRSVHLDSGVGGDAASMLCPTTQGICRTLESGSLLVEAQYQC
jgi:hypothetical protein